MSQPQMNSKQQMAFKERIYVLLDKNEVSRHFQNLRSKEYKCGICEIELSSKERLEQHVRTHVGQKPFRCKLCGKGYESGVGYKQHMNRCTNEDLFKCDICGKEYSTRVELKKHLQKHPDHANSNENNRDIENCDSLEDDFVIDINNPVDVYVEIEPMEIKEIERTDVSLITPDNTKQGASSMNNQVAIENVLSSASESEKDESTEIEGAEKQCSSKVEVICSGGRTKKKRIGRYDKVFKCPYSDCKFTTKYRMAQHINARHTKKVIYKCDECPFVSCHPGSVPRHKLQHSKEKPFVCRICKSGFKQKYHLKMHYAGHTSKADDKIHKCVYCPFEGVDEHSLKWHKINEHKSDKYFCNECDFWSASSSVVQRHMFMHSEEKPLKCNLCDYQTIQQRCLERHIKKMHK